MSEHICADKDDEFPENSQTSPGENDPKQAFCEWIKCKSVQTEGCCCDARKKITT